MDAIWDNIFRHQESESVGHFLSTIPIFAGLKTRELKALERIVHTRVYRPQEAIFHETDPGVGLYIIRSGSVRISLPVGKDPALAERRSEIILTKLGPGDFFGEAALPDAGPRSATAVAEEESHLIGLFRPDLHDFCQRHPETGVKVLWNICEVLARRLRQSNHDLMRIRRELSQ